jgi:hypothetical protein
MLWEIVYIGTDYELLDIDEEIFINDTYQYRDQHNFMGSVTIWLDVYESNETWSQGRINHKWEGKGGLCAIPPWKQREYIWIHCVGEYINLLWLILLICLFLWLININIFLILILPAHKKCLICNIFMSQKSK